MSIIQKLENSYVAILRVVVIVVASILLLAATVFGVMSIKAMLHGQQDKMEVKSVDPKDVLAEVTPTEKRTESNSDEKTASTDEVKKNPYQAEYDKTYTTVSEFVSTTSKNQITVQKDRLFSLLDQNLAAYKDDEVKAQYIKGLAAAFKTSLSDKRVIARVEKPLTPKRPVATQVPRPAPEPVPAQVDADGNVIEAPTPAPAPPPEPVAEELPYKESPIVVINEVLTAYNKIFAGKLAEATMQRDKATNEQLEAKANATTRMMIAAGLFGGFLLVIFLTIAIRIERNLRDIAARKQGLQPAAVPLVPSESAALH